MSSLARLRVGRNIDHITREYERFLTARPHQFPLSRAVYKQDMRFGYTSTGGGWEDVGAFNANLSMRGFRKYAWALSTMQTFIRWRYHRPAVHVLSKWQPTPSTFVVHWQLQAHARQSWEGYSVYKFDFDEGKYDPHNWPTHQREHQSGHSNTKPLDEDYANDGKVLWHRIERVTPPPGWFLRSLMQVLATEEGTAKPLQPTFSDQTKPLT